MRFIYSAQDQHGRIVKGDIEAADRKAALSIIAARGLTPLSLAQSGRGANRRAGKLAALFSGRLTTTDIVFIIRHLGAILGSGTDLLSALSIIAEEAPKPLVRAIMLDIRAQVVTGKSLSDSFASWETQFDPVFLSLLRAGEASGNLVKVLQDYSVELRKESAFHRKVKGALFYPAILMTALAGMMLLMFWVVVPRLQELFRTTGAPPPWYTAALFFLSDALRNNTAVVFSIFALLLSAVFLARRHRIARRRIIAFLWHIPYLSRIQNYSALLRFSKTLSSLIEAGFNMKQALMITAEAVGPPYDLVLRDISERQLERGISLSDALRPHHRLFPVLLVSTVAAGEKGGKIARSLDQMAEFYEEETLYNLERFVTLMEPALIVIVGLVVGLMVGSLISPIYRFIGRF